MFSLENNTFKFVFEDEIGDEGRRLYTLDVWQDGNWIAHTSFEPHEAWGLANSLTNGILDSIVGEVEGRDVCEAEIYDPKRQCFTPCGSDGFYCPTCEYVITQRDKNVRGEA
jgi:hypothetical protein